MAITKRELQISNQSYTNKDFEAVYLELLDYAEKISKRFSPANSNESDPFVVLLKLVAFATDKINYNADKNILEQFMSSCTQEKSMRALCEMLGYSMHYYEAANTNVIFKYKFTGATGEENIIIPKFSTVSDGNTTQYVTIADAVINKSSGTSLETPVLQGKRKIFTVLGSEVIQLENISNNKLYFPELYVAQNGVFIQTYVNETLGYSWEQVENLNTAEYGSKVFKFGFDTILNRPYIEFPDWLDEIIGSGLRIDYVVTDGAAGNVGVKELTSAVRLTKGSGTFNQEVKDEDIIVVNSSAANNGKDIETISEAYEGYKKTIGTFETLVTCRDYANYIYKNLEDICSNIQVGDRRADINYSVNVVQHTEYGTSTLSEATNVTANDLCLYPLKPLTNRTYTGLKTTSGDKVNFVEGGYDDAYRHLLDTRGIKNTIENSKSISHDYKNFTEHSYTYDGTTVSHGDLLFIKDNYQLNAVISTSYKVNVLEQLDIKYAIKNALIEAFNSRTMDWGEEIPFENIVDVIMKADRRITNVSLMQPDHSLEFVEYDVNATDEEKRITSDDATNYNFWIDYIITKNILEGHVSAYDYDGDFKYDFIEQSATKLDNVVSFSSYCNLPIVLKNSSNTINLTANESVQFLAPSLITGEGTFPYGVHYNLKLASGAEIPKNADYNINDATSYVAFIYTEDLPTVALFTKGKYIITTNNGEQPVETPYNIITPNFDMWTTQALSGTSPSGVNMHSNDLDAYKDAWNYAFTKLGLGIPTLEATTINTKEEVTHKIFNEELIKENKKCYWFTNAEDNEIKWDNTVANNWEYLLKENEYFFYSDTAMTSLFSYGPGTTLRLKGDSIDRLGSWKNIDPKSIEEITKNGLESLKLVFHTKAFNADAALNIKVNEIITLTEGNSISIINADTVNSYTINNNDFRMIDDSVVHITYGVKGSSLSDELPNRSSLEDEYRWKARALLDLDCGPNLPQKLNGAEQIVLKDGLDQTKVIENPKYLKLSVDAQVGGGKDVSLGYYDVNLNEVYPNAYTYEYNNQMVNSVDKVAITDLGDSYVVTVVDNPASGTSITCDFYVRDIPADNVKGVYISVYRNDLGPNNAAVSFSVDRGTYKILNTSETSMADKDTFLLKINGATKLTMTIARTAEAEKKKESVNLINTRVFIDKPLIVNGNNSLLKGNGDYNIIAALDKYYSGTDIKKKFYSTAELDDSKRIELSSRCTLDNPAAFLDYNNVANKWVLAKIDFDNSNIEIAANCKLKG